MDVVAPEAGVSRAGGAGHGVPRVHAFSMVVSTLNIAATGIFTNKARTVLTLLGVIIGVASVIVAVGIGTARPAR